MKILLICLIVFQIGEINVWAHPASNINLTYNYEQETLDIIIDHNTSDRERDYIRKLEIYRGEAKLYQEYFHRQAKLDKFEETVPLAAEPGDKLVVRAFSQKGGIKEIEFIVPDEEDEGKK